MNSRQHRSFLKLASFLFILLMAISPAVAAPQSPQAQAPGSTASDLQSRAESGDSGAQYRLAISILKRDNGSADDIQSAVKWLRASAARNNANSAFYLGYLYEHGKFVPKDYKLAFQNYRIAAEAHYGPAENNLAWLYLNGQGVAKSAGKAMDLYIASAQHGDPVGQLNLASLYYTGHGVPLDYKEAFRWLQRSADSHLPEADDCLAYFYFNGIVVPRDYAEAARLVRLAAQSGVPSAETNLAYLYETGKGVPLDYVAAYTWYSRAIAAGNFTGAEHRKQLAQIMTQKQLDEANSLTTASVAPASASPAPTFPAPPPALQPAVPVLDGFSLLNTRH
jgi:uncharacterized protein